MEDQNIEKCLSPRLLKTFDINDRRAAEEFRSGVIIGFSISDDSRFYVDFHVTQDRHTGKEIIKVSLCPKVV